MRRFANCATALTAMTAMTACSSSSGSNGGAAPAPTATVTTTASAAATPSTPATQLCAPSNTRIHDYGGQGAAGTEFNEFVVTNVSSTPCRSGGYPGFTLIGTDGHPLPTTVTRESQQRGAAAPGSPTFFLVAPGRDFFVEFSWTALGRGCNNGSPPPAKGLRVTLPDNRDSAYVPLSMGESIIACQGRLDAFRVYNRRQPQ